MVQNQELEDIVNNDQKGYLSETNLPKPKRFFYGLSEIFGKTLEYYTTFIPSRKLKDKLSERLENYNFDEVDKIYKEPFLDVKHVREGYNQGGLLKVYERFWSCWNKPVQRPIRAVYDALGGSEHPFKATMGAFTFSGAVIHGLHPIVIPLYTMHFVSGNGENILTTWAAVATTYILLGIPVAISKIQSKKSLKQVIDHS